MKSKLPFYSVPDSNLIPPVSGKMERDILIICFEEEAGFPVTSHLEKILGAANINLVNDAGLIIMTKSNEITLSLYFNKHKPKTVLIFGAKQREIGLLIQAPKYQWVHFSEMDILIVDFLSDIMGKRDLKMQLWQAIKVKFLP